MVGILDYGLAKVADLMIKHVISPALNFGAPVSFVAEVNPDSQVITEATLNIVPSSDPKVDLACHSCPSFFFFWFQWFVLKMFNGNM